MRLNSKYEHTIYFDTLDDQRAYFSGKVVKTFSDYAFVRRSYDLHVEARYVDAVKWNYLYLRNPDDSKEYYYFINKVEYVSDLTVKLTLELDLLQTYQFNFGLLDCFIEREHVGNDTLGAHTVDEGLDAGEYVNYNFADLGKNLLEPNCVVILSTFNPYVIAPDGSQANSFGGTFNGIYSGLGLYVVEEKDYGQLSRKLLSISELLDGIVAMWAYNTKFIELAGDDTWDSEIWCHLIAEDVSNKVYAKYYTPDLQKIGGTFKPKNNKLFTYPFNALYVHNNSGSSANYRIERFANPNNVGFNLLGAIAPDCSVRLIPNGYNLKTTKDVDYAGNEYGLSLQPYPTCAWNSDTYKIWLANNQNAQKAEMNSGIIQTVGGAVSTVAGIAGIIAGIYTGGSTAVIGGSLLAAGSGGLSIASGVNSIQSTIGKAETAAMQPDQARGQYSATVNCAHGMQTFVACQKQITPERALIIDDFFTMYGYKVNRIGEPSLKNRKSFTYVKTQGCHVTGRISNEDIVAIETIFNKGVTWWVNGDTIGDYSVDNSTL